MKSITEHAAIDINKVLVGNKIDLVEDRVVPYEECE